MKRLLLLCLLPLVLTGCAGAPDAGDLLPILTAGVSMDADGGLELTAEAVRQEELEGTASSTYLTAHGDSPDDLFAQADALMANSLYFSHARTFIIDESLARAGLRPLVGSLLDRGDVRLTLRLAVARDAEADDLVRAKAVAAQLPGEALGDLLDLRAEQGDLPDLPLSAAADALLAGADFSLPALTLTDDGRVLPDGQADFRLGRLAGFSGGDAHA